MRKERFCYFLIKRINFSNFSFLVCDLINRSNISIFFVSIAINITGQPAKRRQNPARIRRDSEIEKGLHARHRMPDTVAPLLNEYKHSLLLSRLLQTISGGIKFKRGLPFSCYVTQSLLWLLPFLLSLPLTGLSFVPWSGLYLGIIYGGILGLVSFSISILIGINGIYVKKRNETFEEDEDINSFSSVLFYVFALKTPPNLIVHSIISGLTGFTSFVLLDVGLMREIMPTGVAVLVHVLGWGCVCTGHYSLLVNPPVDFNVYRTAEQDRVFQLRFISRSFYVFCFGLTFIVTK